MDLIDLRGFCGNLRDTKLDLMITGSCRGLLAKPSPYLLPQAWAHKSNRRGAAVALVALGAGDWSG
jgi:hypothetical protein